MVALLANLEQRIMTLNVGGLRYVTTAATLAAVENSFLWKLVFLAPPHNSPRSGQSGEFFIDRTNRVRVTPGATELINEASSGIRHMAPNAGQGMFIRESKPSLDRSGRLCPVIMLFW